MSYKSYFSFLQTFYPLNFANLHTVWAHLSNFKMISFHLVTLNLLCQSIWLLEWIKQYNYAVNLSKLSSDLWANDSLRGRRLPGDGRNRDAVFLSFRCMKLMTVKGCSIVISGSLFVGEKDLVWDFSLVTKISMETINKRRGPSLLVVLCLTIYLASWMTLVGVQKRPWKVL